MEPLVVVNHKTYETAQADAAVELAKAIRNAQRQGVHMISAVSAFDLSAVVTGSPGLTV